MESADGECRAEESAGVGFFAADRDAEEALKHFGLEFGGDGVGSQDVEDG